jgi:hypothetical protein
MDKLNPYDKARKTAQAFGCSVAMVNEPPEQKTPEALIEQHIVMAALV